MALLITAAIVSEFKRHGSAGAKPMTVHSVASSKFNAVKNLLQHKTASSPQDGGEQQDESSQGTTPENSSVTGVDSTTTEKAPKSPKAYGEHGGNIHVHNLWTVEIKSNEELDKVSMYVANITSYIEAKKGFDLAEAKYQYRVYKDSITKSFADKFGTNLSKENTSILLDTLAKQAFTYTQHQIRITIVSDEEISGARKTPEGKWILTIKSKMYYTKGRVLLSSEERKLLESLPKDRVEARKSNLAKIPAILVWDARTNRYLVRFDGVSVVVADSY